MWTDTFSALVLVAVAGVLAWLVRRSGDGRRRTVWAVGLALSLSAALWVAAGWRGLPEEEEVTPFEPVAMAGDGYVTSDTCRSCHPREHATWHASYHRTMTQRATPESVRGDFDDVRLNYHGVDYHLQRDGDLFFFEAHDHTDPEAEPYRRPVVLLTGSHHLQAYWYPVGVGRAVESFPFIFVLPEERWVPRESVFLQPTVPLHQPLRDLTDQERWQFERRWNHSCIHCHATHGQPRFPEADTRVAELGIACEACHGPAEEHVRRNRDPRRRYELHFGDGDDDTTVDPSELAAERSAEVCGSCHSVNDPREDEKIRVVTTGTAFRPGDDLDETRILCEPNVETGLVENCPETELDHRFWPDGMLRVSGRELNAVVDSPCYAGGEFSCVSCHRLHPPEDDPRPLAEWASDQLGPGMGGNSACTQCHGEYEDEAALVAHTNHPAGSAGSNCYDCHMPYTSYGLLKALRSHQVSSPSVRSSLETGRPNACNQCHLDRSLGWASETLAAWYGHEPVKPTPDWEESWDDVPASAVWALSGDAGQRALMAWSYGWDEALRASGAEWMPAYLSQLLVDPYDAVRLVAERSLRTHEGFADVEYDLLAPPLERERAARRIFERWREMRTSRDPSHDRGLVPQDFLDPRLATDAVETAGDGAGRLAELYSRRDNRVVLLTE